MNKPHAALLGALVALSAAPAFANEAPPTLAVAHGTVMTSNGGEFVTATDGKTLLQGERVMVGEGASASVVYANGCAYEYGTPGVYAVQPTCTGGGAGQSGGTDTTTSTAASSSATGLSTGAIVGIAAGAIAGVAVIANVLDDDDEPAPPISR